MIDNRLRKIKNHEIDNSLSELTDTEVLLNFQCAITSLYPHLIRIHAHAYESWDDIVIPLFYEMVYKTFSFKYGVEIMADEAHPFLFTLRCYKGIHHIQCLPKASSFQGILNNEKFGVSKENLEGKKLIFKSFGDSINCLTMGLDSEDAHAVHFNLVEVDVVCAQSNKRIGIDGCTTFFIHKDDVEFEFVAETFNQKLQK